MTRPFARRSPSSHLDINGLRLLGPRFGVGRYLEYLLQHWSELDWPFSTTRLLTPAPISDDLVLPEFIEHRVVPSVLPRGAWEQVALPRHREPGGLLFCPGYVAPVVTRGKIVVTHLGSYEALPSAFGLPQRIISRLVFQTSARRADRVITVSESSRSDIMRFYGLPAEKIEVIPLGVASTFRPLDDLDDLQELERVRQRYCGGRRFLLFVGKLTPRRNIPNLVEALAAVRREHDTPYGLLLIGENSGGYDLARLAREAGVADAVVHIPYMDHTHLPVLYNAAEVFVYPSSYEGFGMPVLEAMACGVPSVAIQGSAFPEFADGALLAADGSSTAIAAAISRILSNPDVRAGLVDAGLSRAQEFGWTAIAQRTLDVLQAVARS